jgi:hypothetical protein
VAQTLPPELPASGLALRCLCHQPSACELDNWGIRAALQASAKSLRANFAVCMVFAFSLEETAPLPRTDFAGFFLIKFDY